MKTKGLTVSVSSNYSDRKGNNEASCKTSWKSGNKTKESIMLDCANFATPGLLLTNSPLMCSQLKWRICISPLVELGDTSTNI